MKSTFTIAGFVVVLGAALAFGLHRSQGLHKPIAPWDYADLPNTHPVDHPGAAMPMPEHIIVARNGVAVTPDGIKVSLLALSKGNTTNWSHWWEPSGGPFTRPPETYAPSIPDQPARTDGRVREMLFALSSDRFPVDASINGYLPDQARDGLPYSEREFHGWSRVESVRLESASFTKHTTVYVDDPSENRYLVGVASGEWTTIDTAKCDAAGPLVFGRVVAKGAWGTATIVSSTLRPLSVKGSSSAITRGFSGRPMHITLAVEPLSGPLNQEMKLQAFDVEGNAVPLFSDNNLAMISPANMPRIASFAVLARPYVYLEFDGIHFDPDSDLWKGAVWGPDQPSLKLQIGDVTAELSALIWTKPGDKPWNKDQYVLDSVFTPAGAPWKDYPAEFDNTIVPMLDVDGKTRPRPWHAVIRLHDSPASKAVGRIEVFGSNSPTPAEGVNPSWNLIPSLPSGRDDLRPFPSILNPMLALAPQATYGQIRIEVASGPWITLSRVTLNAEDIRSNGPDFRGCTLEVGADVHFKYSEPGNRRVDRPFPKANCGDHQERVVAILKSGATVELSVSHYRREAGKPGESSAFEFDREATVTEGDVIALPDVSAFEVQGRPLNQGTFVVKLPRPPTE